MTTSEAWAERVAAWQASGKSAGEVARELGIHPSGLYLWSRRLRKPAETRAWRGRASVPSLPMSVPLARVLREGESKLQSSSPVVIEVAGARILVTADADERTIGVALRALGALR